MSLFDRGNVSPKPTDKRNEREIIYEIPVIENPLLSNLKKKSVKNDKQDTEKPAL